MMKLASAPSASTYAGRQRTSRAAAEESTMTNKRTINFVALAISIVAWLWLYVFLHPRPPAIDRRAHEAVGTVLAGEAVKRLDPSARLILIARDPQNFKVPASEAQVSGFRSALKKAGKSVA